jgi:hypothetical protein
MIIKIVIRENQKYFSVSLLPFSSCWRPLGLTRQRLWWTLSSLTIRSPSNTTMVIRLTSLKLLLPRKP